MLFFGRTHMENLSKFLFRIRCAAASACFIFLGSAFAGGAPALPREYPLWPEGKVPPPVHKYSQRQMAENKDGESLRFVDVPSFRLYRPDSKERCGLVVVCPGGSYTWLCYKSEGVEPAEWLAKNGVAAMVLKYRVPNNPEGALQDALRAVRLARANAKEWNVNPDKIALMGFSAGGNLCARVCSSFGGAVYEPVDAADSLSARPDAAILMYPAYCDVPWYDKRWKGASAGKPREYSKRYALAPNLRILKNSPPAFIWQNMGDDYGDAAFAYYLALKDAGIPACLHIIGRDGHGGGMGAPGKNSLKKTLCMEWLESMGFPTAKPSE